MIRLIRENEEIDGIEIYIDKEDVKSMIKWLSETGQINNDIIDIESVLKKFYTDYKEYIDREISDNLESLLLKEYKKDE